MRFRLKLLATAALCGGLSACGTTFQLPELGEEHGAQASKMFAEARQNSARKPLSKSAAEARFSRVARRVAPVGKKVCEQVTAEKRNLNCNVDIAIDRTMKERNAYFTYKDNEPIIRLSLPLIQDSASDHEVAFVMSHEFGHLIGRHIEKQRTQAAVGALVLGTIAAAASAQNAAYGGTYDHQLVETSMEIGAAAGSMAYSQTYELESDTLGTRIAHAAGYDPVKGARFFARPEDVKTSSGKLSFWGTHPPDEKRIATVLATMDEIDNNIALRKVEKSQ